MISINLSNLTLILGAKTIFRDLSWEIQQDQKIGLVGPNGAGKSSLFKLITGEYIAEPGGSIARAKGVTVGYLPQQPEFHPSTPAFHLALDGNPRVAELERELAELESRLGKPSVYEDEKTLSRTLELHEKTLVEYKSLGGASYPERVRELLDGLGLPEEDFAKPIGVLSGGQKKLIGLVRLLLVKPDILLLDEPDNHLDLPGKVYLEKLIQTYPGAVILISHDRYLLDAVVTDITEIEDGRLTTFAGNYTEYILDKQERMARAEELYQIQQRSIARMEMALKRYQQWVQVSDKFASRVRAMQTRLDKVRHLDRPVLEHRKMGLELNGWRGSNRVLELVGVYKSFARPVLVGVRFLIRHGERVGLIGPNSSGKSVLMRLILGMETPDAGLIKIGPSIKVGYYAQEHETLESRHDPNRYCPSSLCDERNPTLWPSCCATFSLTNRPMKRSARFLAANARDYNWHYWSFQAPTSCCWMSLRIISISLPLKYWKTLLVTLSVRSWSSLMTVISSTAQWIVSYYWTADGSRIISAGIAIMQKKHRIRNRNPLAYLLWLCAVSGYFFP